MGSYSVAVRTTATAVQTALWELRTAAGIDVLVYEIGIFITGGSSGQLYALARSPIQGVTPSSPVTVLPDDGNGPAGNTKVAIAWTGKPPPMPYTGHLRRYLPMTSSFGHGVVWTFPRGLAIPPASSLGIWNIGLGSAVDIYVHLDE